MKQGSIFSIAFLRGREKSESSHIHVAKSAIERSIHIVKANVAKREIQEDEHYLSKHVGSERWISHGQRMLACFAGLKERLLRFGICVHPIFNTDYVSNTESAKGVPMFVAQYGVLRTMNTQSAIRAYNDKRLFPRRTGTTPNPPNNEGEFRVWLLEFTSTLTKDEVTQVCEAVRINPGTLAAWRAHETRGTYG